jgi:hypothetical protein
MQFQTDEGAQCKTNVITLANGAAELSAVNAGELLERTMILLDALGTTGIHGAGIGRQVEGRGCPVFRVAVFVNEPKHADMTIATQMHDPTVWRDVDGTDSERLSNL